MQQVTCRKKDPPNEQMAGELFTAVVIRGFEMPAQERPSTIVRSVIDRASAPGGVSVDG